MELQESLPEAQAALDIIQQRTGEGETKTDVSEGHVRFGEKKRLDWAGKTCMYVYTFKFEHIVLNNDPIDLAPLTTVGNLVCFPSQNDLNPIHLPDSLSVAYALTTAQTSLVAKWDWQLPSLQDQKKNGPSFVDIPPRKYLVSRWLGANQV